MRRLFADTYYWVALLNPKDRWFEDATAFDSTSQQRLVTTDLVLAEFLAFYSRSGSHARSQAASTVRRIVNHAHVEVVSVDRKLFLEGLRLYERRPDKAYSQTDCISMQVMRREGITEVLSNDHHFEQEGFQLLFPAR
ncbi:MAG: type II toxin-antitoxin system VapC family toxin [Gammaproteobacteria bacterium]